MGKLWHDARGRGLICPHTGIGEPLSRLNILWPVEDFAAQTVHSANEARQVGEFVREDTGFAISPFNGELSRKQDIPVLVDHRSVEQPLVDGINGVFVELLVLGLQATQKEVLLVWSVVFEESRTTQLTLGKYS